MVLYVSGYVFRFWEKISINFHNSTTKIGANSLVMHTLVYEPAKLYVNYEVVFCLCCHPFLAVVTWPVSQPR